MKNDENFKWSECFKLRYFSKFGNFQNAESQVIQFKRLQVLHSNTSFNSIEFGKIPKFSRLAEQAGKTTNIQ